MDTNFLALLLGTFLAETVKNVAKGSANRLGSNGKSWFYPEFTSLGLSESATPEEIIKQLEAKPEMIEVIQQKVESSPAYVKELFEITKTRIMSNSGNVNNINANKIENVLNQPTGTFNFFGETSKPNHQFSKPQGLINLPREKNDFFVEQSNVFSRLDAELAAHHLGYLHGTHGLGKTTTLVEYAFARQTDYDFICYVLATDGAIDLELARFADKYLDNVAAEDTPAQKALKVKDYLEENARWTKESKNWLIIFDNLESKQWIEKYFPKTAKGDCLYACNERLYIGNNREVEFEQFTQAEAELFVYQRLNDVSEKQHEDIPAESLAEYQKLIARLGRLPLALNIATAYLIETKLSIDDYIALLAANVHKFLKYIDTHKEYQHNTAFEAF